MKLVACSTMALAWVVLAAVPDARAQKTDSALSAGFYASRQYVSSRALTRPSNRYLRVRTTSLLLHEVLDTEEGWVVESRYCAVEQEPLGRVRTTIGQAFVDAMPPWSVPLDVRETGDGRISVRLPDHVMVLGADLTDPAGEPLPEDEEDPRVTDPDGDGHPGISVDVEGMVSGQVYLVQRLVRGLSGILEGDGRMSGQVTGAGEQRVIGASNTILRTFTPQFEHNPDPERNVFVWVPAPGDSTCAEVVADRQQLFGED